MIASKVNSWILDEDEAEDAYFQGAITKTTPNGSLLISRLKPGLSGNTKSFRDSSAMSSMYSARSRKPLISPGPCDTGLGHSFDIDK